MDRLIEKAQAPLPPDLERWADGEPYRRFLYWLILEKRPQAVVELGVEFAQTSALMAAAARRVGALSFGVDTKGRHGNMPEIEVAYGWRFLFCDSLGAAEVVRGLLGGRRIGVVFQDSSHWAELSWQEWLYWSPLLENGWTWVCDDVTPDFKLPDEPRGMVQYFARLPGRKRLFPGLHRGNVIGVVEP